ncbi:MAG: ATP-binding cassette domain-containing protein [Gammaproteobacteria bacterium]|nr:ATP-binding cassette domain-containing protein [Gammaproteobacteria bacterium]
MVEIEALTKQFGPITAVDGVSFNVGRGEVLGFLGPNGAGKSTTMKMVTGFLTPDSGRVRVDGHDLYMHPIAVKACIGYLPEGAPLYGDMTPLGFLNFIADVRGLKRAQKKQRIDDVIERVHLQEVLHQRTETLSKGFKRRVGLAQAILHDPDVLILDEPTDGLDPNQKHEVRTLIQEMAENKVIILSTHILEEVDAVCSRAVIIDRGKVLSDGTPEQLLAYSADHNAVRVVLSCPDAEAAARAFGELDGVGAVSPLSEVQGAAAFLVRPNGAALIAAAIGELAREQGWALHQLQVMKGRLDEVFRDITQSGNMGEPS